MGLFNRNKKEKVQSWVINNKKGTVKLTDKYLKLNIIMPKKEQIIFYNDITSLEQKYNFIMIKTNSNSYKIAPSGFRKAESIATELYIQILEKVSEYK